MTAQAPHTPYHEPSPEDDSDWKVLAWISMAVFGMALILVALGPPGS